jgi:2-polyprenyl-3-methyl-5-hydroxy-6-metoxy-1,4-benzoquinol methylase
MANASLIAAEINALPDQPRRWLELGAGDATLLLSILSQTRLRSGREITVIDQQNLIGEETRGRFSRFGASVQLRQQNVLEWAAESTGESYDLVICNLFLHHFREPELKMILAKVSRSTNFFVVCEPRRTKVAVLATRLLWIIGCNQVTRHDAQISVQAGFADHELSALWPTKSGWNLIEKPGGLASHIFGARRADG